MDAMLSWDRGGKRIRPVPIQSDEGDRLLHEVPVDKRLESFHLVRPGQPVLSGGPALAELFHHLPAGLPLAKALELSPRLTAGGYGWIATNRTQLSRFIPGRLKTRASRRLAARLERDARAPGPSRG